MPLFTDAPELPAVGPFPPLPFTGHFLPRRGPTDVACFGTWSFISVACV
jgi:hypothetical protein